MSGIATKTRKFVDIAAPYGVKIYSTRKTIAGMRQIQKYALTIGGAHVNRASLSDFYFIKDNKGTKVDINKSSEGHVLIFPSQMIHTVYPKKTDGQRVSVSGNIVIRPC